MVVLVVAVLEGLRVEVGFIMLRDITRLEDLIWTDRVSPDP